MQIITFLLILAAAEGIFYLIFIRNAPNPQLNVSTQATPQPQPQQIIPENQQPPVPTDSGPANYRSRYIKPATTTVRFMSP